MDMHRKKILIVEDCPINQMIIQEFCKQLDYDFDFSLNGEDALEKISKQEFDLIILDIILPHISGIDVANKLRENNKTTPIIFQTTFQREHLPSIVNIENSDFFTKPFVFEKLIDRINSYLR
jgi:CheY-like chemotaxis protein